MQLETSSSPGQAEGGPSSSTASSHPASASARTSSNGNGNAATSDMPSSSSASSLFNADEAQFMHDSFSSAETFDPFTVGAPGFKVPNVLPANLGGIGAAPGATSAEQQLNGAEQGMTSVPLSQPIGGGGGSSGNGSNTPRGGGYGQDRSWQMQQLQALQAERYKYMSSRQEAGQHQSPPQLQQQYPQPQASYPSFYQPGSLAGPSSLPDTSKIGHSLHVDGGWQAHFSGRSLEMNNASSQLASFGDVMAQQQQQRHQQQEQQQAYASDPYSSHKGPIGDLSSLGARFPSSHQFPTGSLAAAAAGMQPYNQIAAEMGMGMAHDGRTGVPTRQMGGVDGSLDSWQQQAHPAAQGCMAGPPSGMGGDMCGSSAAATSTPKKALSGKPKGSSNASQSTPDPDAPYVFQPAPRPPDAIMDVDKLAESNVIPAVLQDAFFGPALPRLQPHLATLRQEQLQRKAQGLSANIRKDKKEANKGARAGGGGDDDVESGNDGPSSGKKKQPHVLLTDAEKKANHIASEQKRRANIRKGYEMLCELVPSLRDGLDEDGEEGGGDDEQEDDGDDDGGGGSSDAKRGKKRRAADGGTSAADKLEGKSGARSEAIILLKAVDHIRTQIEEHYALVVRKQKLQRQVAQRFGADASCLTAPPP